MESARKRAGRREASRRFLLFSVTVLILSAGALLGGCGIDTYTYYYPPTVSYAGSLMELSHASANDSDVAFLGYDIYYRAYFNRSTADSICSAIYSAANSSSASPSSLLAQLVTGTFPGHNGEKFYKCSNGTDVDPTPLLRVDDGEQFQIQIKTGDWIIYNVDTASDYAILKRSSGRSFYDNSEGTTWLVGDSDFSSAGYTVSGSREVYLVAFAVAYGFNLGSSASSQIYSLPAVFRDPSSSYGAIPIVAH